MKTADMLAIGVCVALSVLLALQPYTVRAQQVRLPKAASEVPGPASGTEMTKEYVHMVGRMAYLWGWPLVNMYNRREAFTQVPEPGLSGGFLPAAPTGQISMLCDYINPKQKAVACPNQDVVYGLGFFALDTEPAVIQAPDFGDRFWVYGLYDARTDSFARIGKPYGTKPGFYLIVGPNWKGKVPDGIAGVVRSSTELANAIPRMFMDDTEQDRKAIQTVINQVVAYPLSRYDGKMKTKDWSKSPHFPAPESKGNGQTEVHWVDPEKFFDQLPKVMKLVQPLPGEEALYVWIESVLQAAANDPKIKKTLLEAAISAEKELISPLLTWRYNGKPAGNGWNSPVNNAQWGTDYLNRTAVARSNIFENTPLETKYFFTDCDEHGRQLNGKGIYLITFEKGQLPPVKGFWSLTLYNDHHFFHPNQLNRYSLGTKNKTLKPNPDGSLTLYASSESPGEDKESNWLPSPDGTFSLYIRAYWPKEDILEGTWTPPVVKRVE
jgi:hypothetical protein